MATTTTTSKISLKLLIDKKTNRVLFAEAGKEFVDFLFTLLSFPLGTVIKLLSKNKMVGCLGNLYQSIEELSDAFIQPSRSKNSVLNPRSPFRFVGDTLLLTDNNDTSSSSGTKAPAKRKFYMCRSNNIHRTVSDNPDAICPQCRTKWNSGGMYEQYDYCYEDEVIRTMDQEATFVETAGATNSNVVNESIKENGFVKEVVTYMVMDNLEVKPMSTISSIALLHKFNIQQVGDVEEKVVELGMDEGLNLLKVSLQSKTVLTTVFLGV
ncbi:hypothetical protein LINGRAHAP2_LOCUS19457 [Linum grandiflorum]